MKMDSAELCFVASLVGLAVFSIYQISKLF